LRYQPDQKYFPADISTGKAKFSAAISAWTAICSAVILYQPEQQYFSTAISA
jgi:hypothetical protein